MLGCGWLCLLSLDVTGGAGCGGAVANVKSCGAFVSVSVLDGSRRQSPRLAPIQYGGRHCSVEESQPICQRIPCSCQLLNENVELFQSKCNPVLDLNPIRVAEREFSAKVLRRISVSRMPIVISLIRALLGVRRRGRFVALWCLCNIFVLSRCNCKPTLLASMLKSPIITTTTTKSLLFRRRQA